MSRLSHSPTCPTVPERTNFSFLLALFLFCFIGPLLASAQNVQVTTLAGGGNLEFLDATGTAAGFYAQTGVAVAPDRTVYVAELSNNTIRKITPVPPTYKVNNYTPGEESDPAPRNWSSGTSSPGNPRSMVGVSVAPVLAVECLVNGSFELPVTGFAQPQTDTVPGWNTVNFTLMEIWPAEWSAPAPGGNQLIELYSNGKDTIYQDFQTTPGEKLTYSFYHRQRDSAQELAAVAFGSPGATSVVGNTQGSTSNAWTKFTGEYTVPAGQKVTRFEIQGVTGSTNYNGTGGNLIDAVSVKGIACPPPVATPTVSFTTDAQSRAENAGPITVTARLSSTSSNAVTVPFTVTGTAQPDAVVTTLAGSGSQGFADGTGTSAQFNNPYGVAVDGSGNVYVADLGNNRIRKITAGGVVTTLAGGSRGFADGTGTSAQFASPSGVAVDGSGNVYVADRSNHLIRKITAGGVVTTLAGSGVSGFADGTGTSAQFNGASGVAVDGSGNVYVVDRSNHRIRKITAGGVVTTLAGGSQGSADGTGANAQFNFPNGVAVDGSGNVYVADFSNQRIRKITAEGVVTTLAGGSQGFAEGTGTSAQFNGPYSVAVDGSGTVYVSDGDNNRIRKITAGGIVTTLAGGIEGFADGIGTSAQFYLPLSVAVDGSGTVYVADGDNHRIRKVAQGDFAISASPLTIAAGATEGIITITPVNDEVVAPDKTVILTMGTPTNADKGTTTVHTATITEDDVARTVSFTTDAQSSAENAGPITVTARLSSTSSNAVTVPFTVTGTAQPDAVVTTLAGSGSRGFADGTGTSAQFTYPEGVAVDGSGTVYVADLDNHRIRKITAGGVVTTLAGSGVSGFAEGTGTNAQFASPTGVAVDGSGNVYVADSGNYRIRKISPGGVVTTLAGSGTRGFAEGTGTSAQFTYPNAVAVDGSSTVYVADRSNNRIRKITAGGVVTTLAGSGSQGFSDGTGTSAQFNGPTGVAVDGSGNVYVADRNNSRIRKVTAGGVVSTLAGSGARGFADGTGASAQFNNPYGVAVDGSGNVYVADSGNYRIRKITAGGVVTTLAGGSDGSADGTGTSAQFYDPSGVAVDGSGTVYVADQSNHLIRKVAHGDFAISASPLTIAAGATEGIITITPVNDEVVAPDKTVILTMGTPTNADKGTTTVHTATITDDDAAPFAPAEDEIITNEDTPKTINVLTNDVGANILKTVNLPAHGTVVFDAAGNLTYTPKKDYEGQDPFSYIATSVGNTESGPITVRVNIASVNDVPVFTKGSDVTVNEDSGAYSTAFATGISAGPANESAQTLTFTATNTNNGLFSAQPAVAADGTLTFTTAPDKSGKALVSVHLQDDGGGSNTSENQHFTIEITAVSDAPVAVADAPTTSEDTAVSIDVLSNDTDVDTDHALLTITSLTQPANGTAALQNGKVVYTPKAYFNGNDSFTYTANDGALNSDPATVSVTVLSVNNAPVANDDRGFLIESGASQIVTPLSNDTDPDSGDVLVITAVGPVSPGNTATFSGATVTFTAGNAYIGSETFTYTASDQNGGTDSGNITITVLAQIVPDTDGVTDSIEDGAPNGGDGDGDGVADRLQFNVASLPIVAGSNTGQYVTVKLKDAPSGVGLTKVTSTPNPNPGTFPRKTEAPAGFLDFEIPGVKGDVVTQIEIFLPANAVKATDYLKYGLEPCRVGFSNCNKGKTEHWYSFIYNEDTGTGAKFTDPVKDGTGKVITPAKVILFFKDGAWGDDDLTVNGVIVDPGAPVFSTNQAPIAVADAAMLDEDTSVVISLLANDSDPDSDALTVSEVGVASNGTVALGTGGEVAYTPNANFNGADTFTYFITDGSGTFVRSTATVTVNPTPDPLVALPDVATTAEDTPVVVPVFLNDSDADGDAFFLIASNNPPNGDALYNPDGTFTYTPNVNFAGTDTFTYWIAGADGVQVSTTVTVTVVGANDAPLGVADASSTDEDTALTLAVLANDSDPDGDALSVASFTQPEHGVVTKNESGTLVYTPSKDYAGSDTFTYTLTDGTLTSAAITVTLTVNAVNDAPAFASEAPIAMTTDKVWVGAASGAAPSTPSDTYAVTFGEAATDVEESAVSYVWELSSTADFAATLLSKEATAAGATVTWADILALLTDNTLGAEVTLYQRITATDADGAKGSSAAQAITFVRGRFTGTEGEGSIPTEFFLNGNYPNPFNPRTTIEFGLPVAAQVNLTVYDLMGREVRVLVSGMLAAGRHDASFDASHLPSGTYIYRLTTPNGSFTKMLTLLK